VLDAQDISLECALVPWLGSPLAPMWAQAWVFQARLLEYKSVHSLARTSGMQLACWLECLKACCLAYRLAYPKVIKLDIKLARASDIMLAYSLAHC
jgi:hypothetical protein